MKTKPTKADAVKEHEDSVSLLAIAKAKVLLDEARIRIYFHLPTLETERCLRHAVAYCLELAVKLKGRRMRK